MRPTAFTWPAPAMPATSVLKISGAVIILINRRNNWLKGLTYCAQAGFVRLTSVPATTARSRPRMICGVSVRPERAGALALAAGDIPGILSRARVQLGGPSDAAANAVPPGGLRRVQRLVGALQKGIRRLASHGRGNARAYGRRHPRLATSHDDLFDLAAYPFRDATGAGRRGFRQDDEELVAAEAAPEIAPPQHLPAAVTGRREHFVAVQMAVLVRDALELIDGAH